MTYIAKPVLHHPTLTRNKVGYTRRDYMVQRLAPLARRLDQDIQILPNTVLPNQLGQLARPDIDIYTIFRLRVGINNTVG